MHTNKNIKNILIMVCFLGLSIGLWTNFKLLWMENNRITPTDISQIVSLGSLLSCAGIWFISMKVKRDQIKKLISYAMIIKFLALLCLFLGNGILNTKSIAFSMIIDTMMNTMITSSIYPLLTIFVKDDKVYSKKSLLRYVFEDISILLGGILVGRTIGSLFFDYNTFLIISIVFLIIAFLFLILGVKLQPVRTPLKKTKEVFCYLKQNKLVQNVLIYNFLANVSYSCVFDLQMLLFTNLLSFSVVQTTFFILITNLLADGGSLLALKYFTPKSERLAVVLKYGLRAAGYLAAVLWNQNVVIVVAICLATLTSSIFEDKTDGTYVNLIKDEYQLMFSSITNIIAQFGMAVGVFICGLLYPYGFRLILLIGSLLTLFTMFCSFRSYHLRKKLEIN